ncbi:MAG: zinc ribbon domain-containing protein [Planctomycetia bacterium]|nr:zinc ribbon domain-containing protein [Planctomycetia bacterium]
MPIYEYKCENCNTEFEELVRGAEIPKCPKCGFASPQRKLSVPATPHSASKGCAVRDAGLCSHPHGGACCGGHCSGH